VHLAFTSGWLRVLGHPSALQNWMAEEHSIRLTRRSLPRLSPRRSKNQGRSRTSTASARIGRPSIFWSTTGISDAVVSHVAQTFSAFADRFSALATVASFVVHGVPAPEARKILDGFGATYMTPFDGFTR
jgi:hypothetical protein